MKVILLGELRGKGGEGDIVEVAQGYAENYLFPQKIAQPATPGNIKQLEERRHNIERTLERLLELGAIPIINENDTVSTAEIKVGDNDTLSAIVAVSVQADLLILLSDINGLYTADPHTHPDAKLISVVEHITPEMEAAAGGAGSRQGTGGMITKLGAAKMATSHGVPMIIANGEDPTRLYDIVDGVTVGTLFLAKEM